LPDWVIFTSLSKESVRCTIPLEMYHQTGVRNQILKGNLLKNKKTIVKLLWSDK